MSLRKITVTYGSTNIANAQAAACFFAFLIYLSSAKMFTTKEESPSGTASSTHSVEIVSPAPAPHYNQYFYPGAAIVSLTLLIATGVFIWRQKFAKEKVWAVSQIHADGATALVVVDMQSDFPAARNSRTVASVKEEIRLAVQNGHFIVILEYFGCGQTNSSLMKELQGYKNYRVVIKSDNDGSAEVKEACEKMGLAPAKFNVVGVNTDACVESTVTGLTSKYPTSLVAVIAKACNTIGGYQWSNFPSLKNVFVQH
jgi:hypothetical protein